MKTKLVLMSEQGARAYFTALKAERAEAARWYGEHEGVLVGEVAKRFKMSISTVRRGLKEAGIEEEPGRIKERRRERWRCPGCRKVVVHVCEREARLARQVPKGWTGEGASGEEGEEGEESLAAVLAEIRARKGE